MWIGCLLFMQEVECNTPTSDTSEPFFRSNRPEYLHPVCSKLEKSGIRVAVGDCSVTEHRRWHPPNQTGKTVQSCACKNTINTTRMDAQHPGSVPLCNPLEESYYENWITTTTFCVSVQFCQFDKVDVTANDQ